MSAAEEPLSAAPPAKRAILAEALKLFASRGVEAVSVRDIAAATGFTNPALFRHFASKEALAAALFESCYRRLVEAVEALPPGGDLRDWLAAVLRGIAEQPEAVVFVFENVRRYWRTLPAELRDRNLPSLMRKRLEAEQAVGRLRPDIDIPLARTVIDGALGQIARATHFVHTPLDPEATADRLADLLLNGFAARPGDPR